jgi:hypothetical protein
MQTVWMLHNCCMPHDGVRWQASFRITGLLVLQKLVAYQFETIRAQRDAFAAHRNST